MGRWMGVEVRIHAFFPLLAIVCLALGASSGLSRGIGLFLVVVAAVVVRETARLLVAAWLGLRLRAGLLLPIGGLFAYANPESQENANAGFGQFAIAFTGPLANWVTALILAALFLGASPDMHLLAQPFITPAYLLRSAMWMQFFMGTMHLLPADGNFAPAARAFNEQMRARFERIVDFLKLHYALTRRDDTAFWRDNADTSLAKAWLRLIGCSKNRMLAAKRASRGSACMRDQSSTTPSMSSYCSLPSSEA